MKKSPFVPVVIQGGASSAPGLYGFHGEGSAKQAVSTKLRYGTLGIPDSQPVGTSFVLTEVKNGARVVQLGQKSIVEALKNYRTSNDKATWERFVTSVKHIAKTDAQRLAADKMDSADGLEEFIFEFSKILRAAGHFNMIPALNEFTKTFLIYSQVLAIQDGLQEIANAKSISQEALFGNAKEIHNQFRITPDEYEAIDINLKSILIQGLRIYTRAFWTEYELRSVDKTVKKA